MISSTLPIVSLVVATVAIAIVGAIVARNRPHAPLQGGSRVGVLLAGALVSFALAFPGHGVFGLLVAANLVLGRGEWVPFSRYPMFSRPADKAWSVVVEDGSGNVIPVGVLGVDPVATKKRFASEERAALDGGAQDRSAARRRAAAAYALTLEQHRPLRGPLASVPFLVCLIEYTVVDGHTKRVRIPLAKSSPP